MHVHFLEAYELSRELPRLFQTCDELLIAMAYVKIIGLRPILPEIHSLLTRNGSLKLVFGLSHVYGITDKEAGQKLLELSKNKNADIRKLNNSGFHPKLYIFNGPNPSIIIGSSNITGHALSSNAEANVLIKNPEQDFLIKATSFFYRRFDEAPRLTRKHIDQYNPRRTSYKTTVENQVPIDPMSLPLPIVEDARNILPSSVWKISPGRDGECWEEWLGAIDDNGDGVIAVWWDVGDLEKFKTWDILKDQVKRYTEDWNRGRKRKTSIGYVTNQLWNFKNNIKTGDVIIIYSKGRVFGIAEVIEKNPYRYKFNESLSYHQQSKVKYLWYHPWPERSPQNIIDMLGKQGTLKRIEDEWIWEYLKEHYFKC